MAIYVAAAPTCGLCVPFSVRPRRERDAMSEYQGDISGTLLSRRGFLQTSGGLVIAFNLFGLTDAVAAGAATGSVQPPPAGRLYAWLAVHPDNTATLFTGKVET